jgi:hypothetical protein
MRHGRETTSRKQTRHIPASESCTKEPSETSNSRIRSTGRGPSPMGCPLGRWRCHGGRHLHYASPAAGVGRRRRSARPLQSHLRPVRSLDSAVVQPSRITPDGQNGPTAHDPCRQRDQHRRPARSSGPRQTGCPSRRPSHHSLRTYQRWPPNRRESRSSGQYEPIRRGCPLPCRTHPTDPTRPQTARSQRRHHLIEGRSDGPLGLNAFMLFTV